VPGLALGLAEEAACAFGSTAGGVALGKGALPGSLLEVGKRKVPRTKVISHQEVLVRRCRGVDGRKVISGR
jgi:hypothetical protein